MTACTVHNIHHDNEEMNHKKGNVLDTNYTCVAIVFVITEPCSQEISANKDPSIKVMDSFWINIKYFAIKQ